MKNDLTAAGTYIAAVIGAGFASGGEILQYFAIYGKFGFLGIVISSLFFGFSAAAVLRLCKEHGIGRFDTLTEAIFPKPLAKAIQLCGVLFMFFIFSAMLSAGGETLTPIIGTRKIIGVLIILTFVTFVLFFDVRGLMAANGIMAALIVLGTLSVCFYIFNFREIPVFAYKGKWAVSGVLYTGYNMLTAGAVLPPMSKYVKNPERTGAIAGACIFLLLGALWGIISIYYGKIPLGAVPMLTICKRHGELISIIYSAVFFLALLTTALANGFALTDFLPKKSKTSLFLLAALGFFFASIPFEFFVGSIYRLAGYSGAVLMLWIIIKYKKIKILRKKP